MMSLRRCSIFLRVSAFALAANMTAAAYGQEAEPTPPEPIEEQPATTEQGRSGENAIRTAEDAFGTSIGRETIGLYSSQNIRGFSPISAGNARIEGLYFDQIWGLTSRIRRCWSSDWSSQPIVDGIAVRELLQNGSAVVRT